MVPTTTTLTALVTILFAFSAWWLFLANENTTFPPQGLDCRGSPIFNADARRVFNDSTLAQNNGDDNRALLLVVLGEVFDVSSGTKFYGRPPDAVLGKDAMGYHIFIGRDSSRAFATGDFVNPRADLDGLTSTQVNSVVEWRTFYRHHKTYSFVGVHAGTYYSCQGEATASLLDIEAVARYAQDAAAAEAALLAKFKTCNSIFKPAEKFSEVSCPHSSGDVMVPRRLFWRSVSSTVTHATAPSSSAEPQTDQQRCVCITLQEDEEIRVSQPPTSVGGVRTERFEDCEGTATSCRLSVK